MILTPYISNLATVEINAHLSEILDTFRSHKDLTFIPVVNSFNEPLGIVRETSLRKFTYSMFGRELIHHHTIFEFISECPVITDAMSFQELIETPTFQLKKEGFIVVNDGRYYGFLPINKLIEMYEFHRLDTQAQLLQVQKMESVGNLAGGIAHDFNNILASITGHLTLIRMKLVPSPDETVSRYLQTIETLSSKAANLTKQLLGFARGGKYKVEPLNLNETITHVVSLLESTFSKAIIFHLDLKLDLGIVEGDRGQFEQVLMNLFINSRDAIDGAGEITIETNNLSCENISNTHPISSYRYGVVEIRIQDTGCGIPEENLKRIFDPFFTTKERGKGTGMGLAMVYGIIRSHGGHISVESGVGKGTTFILYLPKSAKSPEKIVEEKPATPITSIQLNSRDASIMVVDDDIHILTAITLFLEEIGYIVHPFTNGKDAINFYSRNHVDIVLIDMIMPIISGQQVYTKLREHNKELVAIFMSGYNSNDSMQSLLSATNAEFLQKPFSFEQLKLTISNILAVA